MDCTGKKKIGDTGYWLERFQVRPKLDLICASDTML